MKVQEAVFVEGVGKTRKEWCEHLGVSSQLLSMRMKNHGISLENAIRMGGRRSGDRVKTALQAKAAKTAALMSTPLPSVPLRLCQSDRDCYVTEAGEIWNHRLKRWLLTWTQPATPGEPDRLFMRVRIGGQVRSVHTVVAEAWVDNPEGLPWVTHKDEDSLHNHKDNLVWVRRSGWALSKRAKKVEQETK